MPPTRAALSAGREGGAGARGRDSEPSSICQKSTVSTCAGHAYANDKILAIARDRITVASRITVHSRRRESPVICISGAREPRLPNCSVRSFFPGTLRRDTFYDFRVSRVNRHYGNKIVSFIFDDSRNNFNSRPSLSPAIAGIDCSGNPPLNPRSPTTTSRATYA